MTGIWRRILAGALVALTAAAQPAQASTYFYFRGGAQSGQVTGVRPPSPAPDGTFAVVVDAPSPDVAFVGERYSATTYAYSNAGAVTFSVAAGSLPSGIAINPATGTISGYPAAPGAASATILGRDASGRTATASLSIEVTNRFSISGSPANSVLAGAPYSATFTLAGGEAPYAFSTGALPDGLTLSFSGAVATLSGTPTTAGRYPIVVTGTEAHGLSVGYPFALDVIGSGAAALTISGHPAATATENVAYSAAFAAAGGSGGYVYSLAAGALPGGLSLDASSGIIAGTPQTGSAGTYQEIAVRVVDSSGAAAVSAPFALLVVPAGPLALDVAPDSKFSAPALSRYALQLVASGGAGGYVFGSTGAALPAGLSLDPATGRLSGSPTTPGYYDGIVLQVTDAASATAEVQFELDIGQPAPLLIAGTPSATAAQWNSYSATFTGFDGAGYGYRFASVGSALPPGLSLADINGVSGLLSGVPTVPGVYPGLKIQVVDGEGNVASTAPFAITVTASPVAIAGWPAESATIGEAYYAQFNASGGPGNNVFSLVSGTLPAGIGLYPEGLIYGYPLAEGVYPDLVVRVTDALGGTADSTPFAITVTAASTLAVDGSLPAEASTGAAYSAQFTGSGGIGEGYMFSLTSGNLPAGLSLNPSTGEIAGVPSQAGFFPNIQVRIADSSGAMSVSGAYGVRVAGPLAVTGTAKTAATGIYYNAQFAASGGIAPYVYAMTGTLPSGLALDTTGLIYGTPAAGQDGTFAGLAVVATDARGTVASSGPFAIAVVTADPIVVSGTASREATVGTPYAAQFSATGGFGPLAWTLIGAEDLPPGLAFDAASGLLSGTPTAAGLYAMFAAMATDTLGNSGISDDFFYIAVDEPEGRPLSVATGTPPAAVAGESYAAMFDVVFPAAGGTVPSALSQDTRYVYALAPGSAPLPPGLEVGSLAISGIPSAAGSYGGIVLRVKDIANATVDTAPFSIAVALGAPLAVAGTPAASVVVNTSFSAQFTASGGIAPYSYQLTGTAPWLSISSDGLLQGASWTAGTYPNLVVTVTDSLGATASTAPFTVKVTEPPAAPLTLTGAPATAAPLGDYYWDPGFAAHGGPSTDYVYAVESGSLPDGIQIDSYYGTLSGEPTTVGSYGPIRVSATVAGKTVLSVPFHIIVTTPGGPIQVAGAVSSSAEVGASFMQAIGTAGGDGGPYTVALAPGSGQLPSGLSVVDGRIVGTPTYFDTFGGIALRVSDSSGASVVTPAFAITIRPAPLTISGELPSEVGSEFDLSAQFTAKGGLVQAGTRTAALRETFGGRMFAAAAALLSVGTAQADGASRRYQYRGDNLPPGLSVDPDTGRLTGRPTQNGKYSGVTVSVTDGTNVATTRPVDVNVAPTGEGVVFVGFSFGASRGQVPPPDMTARIKGLPSGLGGPYNLMQRNNILAPRARGFMAQISNPFTQEMYDNVAVWTPTEPWRDQQSEQVAGRKHVVIDHSSWFATFNRYQTGQVAGGPRGAPWTYAKARRVLALGWLEAYPNFNQWMPPPNFPGFDVELFYPYDSPQSKAIGTVWHIERDPPTTAYSSEGRGGIFINTKAARSAGLFGLQKLTFTVTVEGNDYGKWAVTTGAYPASQRRDFPVDEKNSPLWPNNGSEQSFGGDTSDTTDLKITVDLHTFEVTVDRTNTPPPPPNPNLVVTSVKG